MIEKIKKIAFIVFRNNITDETSQENCDTWDSIHHLNFIIQLEIEFNTSFEPEEIAELKSIKDVDRLLKTKLNLL